MTTRTTVTTTMTSSKKKSKKTDLPLDYSFMNVITPKDLVHEEPRGRKERKPEEKYMTKCLKLNNNHIQDVSSLMDVVHELVLHPDAITWIDLSFNNLQKIDPVFCDFPHLQILYLHGNSIEDIKEVDKLGQAKSLKKLALHGNSMETTKHYRLQVLARCPQLINFDMNTVTKAERETAATLFRSLTMSSSNRKLKDNDD
jgi:Leucine-rich repeat (LRR) protein